MGEELEEQITEPSVEDEDKPKVNMPAWGQWQPGPMPEGFLEEYRAKEKAKHDALYPPKKQEENRDDIVDTSVRDEILEEAEAKRQDIQRMQERDEAEEYMNRLGETSDEAKKIQPSNVLAENQAGIETAREVGDFHIEQTTQDKENKYGQKVVLSGRIIRKPQSSPPKSPPEPQKM